MRVYLIRHGETTAAPGTLTGRMPGVHLSGRGRASVRALAATIEPGRLDAIYSSPMERTQETAAALAAVTGLRVHLEQALNEIDFGEWSGMTFDALAGREDWQAFNRRRSEGQAPRGESASEVQRRTIEAIERLRAAGAHQAPALVTHGDIIRSAVLRYLGLPLDAIHRIEIDLAAVTAIDLGGTAPRVLYVNRLDLRA
jgi:probable phosphoglycerate mutase